MPPLVRKIILWVGFFLLAVVLGCMLLLALVSTLEGTGGLPLFHNRAGWPTSFVPVAYIPFFVIALALGVVWLAKHTRRKVVRFLARWRSRSARPHP